MPVTNQNSNQYTKVLAGEAVDSEDFGRVSIYHVDFTQSGAGDATSTVALLQLPAGQVRVITDLSRLTTSAFGASRTLDVGLQAYKNQDGTTVALDADYFASAVDVSSAATFDLNESTTPGTSQLIDSKEGVVVYATVAGGTIPDGATITGYIMVAQ